MNISKIREQAKAYEQANRGRSEPVLPNLRVFRRENTGGFEATVYNPVICLILQGAKVTGIGDLSTQLRGGDALLVSHDLPVTSRITEASPDLPYLALILSLDLGLVRRLYEQVGHAVSEVPEARSLCTSSADRDLIEPLSRYLALVERPIDAEVLGPSILREIHFRLLMSPIGGMLRNLLNIDSHASRISKAIRVLRQNYRDVIMVADLAKTAGMSQSAFHEHFKLVTGTTPLQYQKDLRMISARELLMSGQMTVSMVGFEVGYESPAHFSRDYSRKFGIPPSKDALPELVAAQ